MPFLAWAFASLLIVAASGCGKDVAEYSVEGDLAMGPAKGWPQLEVTSEEHGSKDTKFINPGKKILEIQNGGSSATLVMYTAGRVPVAKFKFPMKAFDVKKKTFYANSYDIAQQYNIGGNYVRKTLRKEYVPHGTPKKCIVQDCYKDFDKNTHAWISRSCPGVKGDLWYVEDYRNDYQVDFTILDAKDPANLVARFTGKGTVQTDSDNKSSSGCVPRLRVYGENGAYDAVRSSALIREQGL